MQQLRSQFVNPLRVVWRDLRRCEFGKQNMLAVKPGSPNVIQGVLTVGRRSGLGVQIDLADAVVIPQGVADPEHRRQRACEQGNSRLPSARGCGSARLRRHAVSRHRHQLTRTPQKPAAQYRCNLKWPVPERVLQHAVQSDQRQNRPGHAPRQVGLLPWLGMPQLPKKQSAQGHRHRQPKLDRHVQRKVVRVVENVAKACAWVKRHEVGIVELAPAPAGPRLLGDQVQHIAPQRDTAEAGGSALMDARHNSRIRRVEPSQTRQRIRRCAISQYGCQQQPANRGVTQSTPKQVEQAQQQQLHHAGTR